MEVRTAVYELSGHNEEVAIDLTDVDSVDVTALKVLAAATVQAPSRRAPPHAARRRPGRAPDAAPVPPDPGRRGGADAARPTRRPAMSDNPHAQAVTNR